MTVSNIKFYPGTPEGSSLKPFKIIWKGNTSQWGTHGRQVSLPIAVNLAAITELINRNSGRTFLLPSLSKVCGFSVTLDQVNRNLTIKKIQEGGDSGIFKVAAEVNLGAENRKTFSFCLNSSKHPQLNKLHHDIYHNLVQARKTNAEYAVKPLFLGKGKTSYEGEQVRLAIFSTDWLEGYTEVDMINAAEDPDGRFTDLGLAAIGHRKIFLNISKNESLADGMINDPSLEDAIAEEMVKIFTIYFNPTTGEGIREWGINNGDFVYKPNNEGFSLKLVTIRSLDPFPTFSKQTPAVNALPFIDNLLMHREYSVSHQDRLDPMADTLSLFPFTLTDICRGIKKGLIEKPDKERARELLFQWLGVYLALDRMSGGLRSERKDLVFRTALMRQEIGRFLFEEEKYPRGVVIEI